jgi:transposase-like protein
MPYSVLLHSDRLTGDLRGLRSRSAICNTTERNLSVDHVTIWRWLQRYAPVLNQLIRREMRVPSVLEG